jgi:hypothetical protein
LELVRGKDGNMRINDGVTRASRAAKLRPGAVGSRRDYPGYSIVGCDSNAKGKGGIAMNDPTRSELMEALGELARRYPHWRFGQLVANVAGWADAEIWDIEDEQLHAAAQAHIDSIAAREKESQSEQASASR